MTDKDDRYVDYPMFKGLQRPLEFMGLQGRYIYWAAGAAGGGILGFIICYVISGFLVGLIALAVIGTIGAGLIMIKQRQGLHSKKKGYGIYIYVASFKGGC